MTWSHEQQQAIFSRGQNLLVAAAAGSGKTSVLVERIIQRVVDRENPVDISRLLVVTFTKAAAAEMRTRIGQALTAALATADNRRHIERQLVLLNAAAISTLHSFCQSIVRQYFYRLDLDPAFRLGGEAEMALIRSDTLAELFAQWYESGEEGFYRLIEYYGGERDDEALAALLLKLHDFSRSHPWPEHWLRGLPEAFGAAEGSSMDDIVWSGLIREKLAFDFEQALSLYDAMLSRIGRPNQPVAYGPVLNDERRMLVSVLASARQGWLPLSEALKAISFGRLPSVRQDDVTDEAKKQYQNSRDKVKKLVNDARDTYFATSPSELLQHMNAMAPVVTDLVRLTLEFQAAYRQAKSARNVLDFSDLEHFCLSVLLDPDAGPGDLTPSAAARELRARFAEVMVDEYQDTNGVQETILKLVSQESNRFMVGDVKQSIYRFRLAEPSLFMDKYNTYPLDDAGIDRRIDLSRNFRSEAGILHAVNFLFQQLMTRNAAEMDYGEQERLNPGLIYPSGGKSLTGPVEVWLIDRDGDETETGSDDGAAGEGEEKAGAETGLAEMDSFEQEAWLIARRMIELKEENREVCDRQQKWRPLTWRDMVVLLRAPSGKEAVLLDVLRRSGIPAYAEENSGYFQLVEVQVMLSLLSVIDNPRQDIPLAAVLRSPLVGMGTAELAEIRLTASGSMWQALTAYGETGGDELLRSRVRDFARRLSAWRTFSRRRGVAELIWRLYDDTGYYDYVGGMPGGALRQANLRALYDRARQYENTNFRGLFRFLRFLDRLRDEGGDMAVAGALGEGEDVVRVMSIHKSKGLEFPVVFVADLGKQFNLRDTVDSVLLHRDLGLGLHCYQPERRFSFPTLAWHGISHRLGMESKAEELRVLYVAFTRAREKLILVGSAAKLAAKCAVWGQHAGGGARALPDHVIAGARTALDWLMPAIMRHADGENLRQYGGCEVQAADASPDGSLCRWQVNVVSAAGIVAEEKLSAVRHPWLDHVARLQAVPAGPVPDWVTASLGWRYGHEAAVGKPAKLSVTEIKRRFASPQDAEQGPAAARPVTAVRPRFIRTGSRSLTAAEKGTAMHTAMQHLDISGDVGASALAAQIRSLADREILTADEAACVAAEDLAAFFATSVGRRLCQAPWVRREMAFSLLLPAERFYPDLTGRGETIFVQGVVDCLFRDESGLVLLDYKTDATDDMAGLAAKYDTQIRLYAEAVQAVLQQPVTEACLYAFQARRVVPMRLI